MTTVLTMPSATDAATAPTGADHGGRQRGRTRTGRGRANAAAAAAAVGTTITAVETRAVATAAAPAGGTLLPEDDARDIVLRGLAAAAAPLALLGAARLDELAATVLRNLAGRLATALRAACGAVASRAQRCTIEERAVLEEILRNARPDGASLLPSLAASLAPSELLALLDAASAGRGAAAIDRLRCRALVYRGDRVLARETALDLLAAVRVDGTDDPLRARTDALVARALPDLLDPAGRLPDAFRRAISAAASAEPDPDASGTTDAFVGVPSVAQRFAASLRADDGAGAAAILAAAAGASTATVARAVLLRDAASLVALVWRAGFDAAVAIDAQRVIGGLFPDEILADAAGDFPLSPLQMSWLLDDC